MSTKTKAKSPLVDCDICGDPCNRSTRKHAQCTKCGSDVCRSCIRTYLLQSVQDPCCPECKHPWNRDFLHKLCGNTWLFKDFRHHRQNLLMDREKAKIPGDTGAVELYRESMDLTKEANSMNQSIWNLEQQLLVERTRRDHIMHQAYLKRSRALGIDPAHTKHWKFIHPCPGHECQGYLSTVGKCAACAMWTCLHCFALKGPHKDSEHTCDPNDLASAQHIKQSTKRCPECGVPCTRISGCTQMWCPQCHTSFSYRTGEVYRQPVHNPERDDWLAHGSAPATRKRKSSASSSSSSEPTPNCTNRLVGYHLFHRNVVIQSAKYLPEESSSLIRRLYRGVADLEGYQLDRIRRMADPTATNTKQMRIRYVLKDLSEDNMKKKLEQDDRRKKHWTQVLHVVTLLYEVLRDQLNHMANNPSEETFRQGLAQHECIFVYVQKRLKEINQNTKLVVPHLQKYGLMIRW